eukprot:CAMPEP_0194494894 /NCGR_PEP_ID=MMETSP0253-20130528/12655_1 /TAXON_ID=2966 /ORGANISM="Noctiluca scintillans" /LENGTH=472 /DNA_ID=CAMNT_0039336071 /DNA_START=34 /DNA_END=1452 /DNA_ORIENTATION=-
MFVTKGVLLILGVTSAHPALSSSHFLNHYSEVVWTDWDQRQVCHPAAVVQPDSLPQLVDLVVDAASQGLQVKVTGAGHSFSQITLTDPDFDGRAYMVNLDKLNSVIEFPSPDDMTVLVEAGIRVHELNAALLAAAPGYALVNTGAIAMQSVAGATQTGTHGTGRELGSMSSQLVGLTLLLANGTMVDLSATQHPEVFDAARVGLGALGIVVRARLSVVPAFKMKRVAMPYDLDQLLVDLPALNQQYERLQWYWTPYTVHATLLLRIPVPIDTDVTGCWPGDVQRSQELGINVTCIDWSFKTLCHEADDATKYTEMEYFVPRENATAFVQDFRAFQASVEDQSECKQDSTLKGVGATPECSLFAGIRYGKGDEMWMSQMYQRDIAVLSMIVLGNATTAGPVDEFSLFGHAVEQLAATYNGRPHWGKMNWATAADVKPQYPRFDDFVQLRAELDPKCMFLNYYLRRVLGVDSVV